MLHHREVHQASFDEMGEATMCTKETAKYYTDRHRATRLLKSSEENTLKPCNWSNKPSILGNGYLILTVSLFKARRLTHMCRVPSFF